MESTFLREIEAAAMRLGAPDARLASCTADPEPYAELAAEWARLALTHPHAAPPPRDHLGSRAARTAVLRAAAGAPPPLSAAWSHSHDAGIAIVTSGSVGIGLDLEPASRTLSPRLQARLRTTTGWAEIGIGEWAMLEAAVKAAPGPRLMSDFRADSAGGVADRAGLRYRIACVKDQEWVVGLALRVS